VLNFSVGCSPFIPVRHGIPYGILNRTDDLAATLKLLSCAAPFRNKIGFLRHYLIHSLRCDDPSPTIAHRRCGDRPSTSHFAMADVAAKPPCKAERAPKSTY